MCPNAGGASHVRFPVNKRVRANTWQRIDAKSTEVGRNVMDVGWRAGAAGGRAAPQQIAA